MFKKILAGLLTSAMLLSVAGAALPVLAEEDLPAVEQKSESSVGDNSEGNSETKPAEKPENIPETKPEGQPSGEGGSESGQPATDAPTNSGDGDETGKGDTPEVPVEGDGTTDAPDPSAEPGTTDEPGETSDPDGETDPSPGPDPSEDPEASESPEPGESPEPTPEPADPAEISGQPISGGVPICDRQLTFNFSVKNAVSLYFRLTGPSGEVASGALSTDTTAYSFTPSREGHYTFSLTAVGEDGGEVTQSMSVEVVRAPELTVAITPDQLSGFAGDNVDFTLTRSAESELNSCSIEVVQDQKSIFTSDEYTDKVSVGTRASRSVTTVTITVTVTDIYGQVATAKCSIPCAVHDAESSSQWARSVRGADITGVWPQDLLAVARTQIGYHESSIDFMVKEDGKRQGYSRYGDWYGLPYEEWCAMFCSFCLEYAGIPESAFPRAANCQHWINQLKKRDLYAPRGTYIPKVGDLVIFEYEHDDDADHVGIVCEVTADKNGNPVRITTIEGNHRAAVCTGMTYALGDGRIAGYGMVNLAYDREIEKHHREQTVQTEDYIITAGIEAETGIPAHAVMNVREIERGTERFDALAEAAQACLDEQEEDAGRLSYARFFEIEFVDEDGTPVTPAAPVQYEIGVPERFSYGEKLLPGAMTFDDEGCEIIEGEVAVTRKTVLGKGGRVFSFEVEGAPEVLGVIVSGEVQLRTEKNEKLRGQADGVNVAVVCPETAAIPMEAELTVTEILPDDAAYHTCLNRLGEDFDPEAETARFFEIDANLNGIKVVPAEAVRIEIICGKPTQAARAVRLNDALSLETEVTPRRTCTEVAFDTDAFALFGVVYANEG